jgi:hypothetical protein
MVPQGFRDRSGPYSHNEYGFRGGPFALEKPPATVHVVIMGASTAYGDFVDDSQTSTVQLEQRLRPQVPEGKVEALNGGLPSWTSFETALHLQRRVLPLDPDLIVILDDRNEIFPQLFRNYRDDYSHYRAPEYDFARSNYGYKKLFRISYLFMLLASGKDGRFGSIPKPTTVRRTPNFAMAFFCYSGIPVREG